MAGGTATKTSALALTALSKIEIAKQAIQHVTQRGLIGVADPLHALKTDPAIVACITALQALQ